jgi:hypothetical protein
MFFILLRVLDPFPSSPERENRRGILGTILSAADLFFDLLPDPG